MAGAEVALIPFAGAITSKFVRPSTFTARHEDSLRQQEQQIQEQIARFKTTHGEDVPPPNDSIGFGQLLKTANEQWEVYSTILDQYKNTSAYEIRSKRYLRANARKVKRLVKEAVSNLASHVGNSTSQSSSQSSSRDSVDSASTFADNGSPLNANLDAIKTSERVESWLETSGFPCSPPPSPSNMARCTACGTESKKLWTRSPEEHQHFCDKCVIQHLMPRVEPPESDSDLLNHPIVPKSLSPLSSRNSTLMAPVREPSAPEFIQSGMPSRPSKGKERQ